MKVAFVLALVVFSLYTPETDAQVLSGLLESRRYHKSFCKLMEPIATEWVASESTDVDICGALKTFDKYCKKRLSKKKNCKGIHTSKPTPTMPGAITSEGQDIEVPTETTETTETIKPTEATTNEAETEEVTENTSTETASNVTESAEITDNTPTETTTNIPETEEETDMISTEIVSNAAEPEEVTDNTSTETSTNWNFDLEGEDNSAENEL
ncbi:mucin-2-like [Atheta coriaria]|uniref:mucin-2-like n=1 Tax=Dalotia coriaria TaxID=877792 RepID=UPI0031F3BCEB